MAATVTRSQSNGVVLVCGTGDLHHGCTAEKSAATVYHVYMDQKL